MTRLLTAVTVCASIDAVCAIYSRNTNDHTVVNAQRIPTAFLSIFNLAITLKEEAKVTKMIFAQMTDVCNKIPELKFMNDSRNSVLKRNIIRVVEVVAGCAITFFAYVGMRAAIHRINPLIFSSLTKVQGATTYQWAEFAQTMHAMKLLGFSYPYIQFLRGKLECDSNMVLISTLASGIALAFTTAQLPRS